MERFFYVPKIKPTKVLYYVIPLGFEPRTLTLKV